MYLYTKNDYKKLSREVKNNNFFYCKVGRAIAKWGAIMKISHEPIYKTGTKNKAKRLRTTTFAFAKLEEQ